VRLRPGNGRTSRYTENALSSKPLNLDDPDDAADESPHSASDADAAAGVSPHWPEPPADVFAALQECRRAGRACVLATVVRTSGSTPRKGAARMLVRAGGDSVGTIGGGRFEKEIVDACVALLAEGNAARPRLIRYQLTRDLAMCCGGEMEVFVEPLVPEPFLIVCGGGHVARAVVPLARAVGFLPVVVDEDPEDATLVAADAADRFPAAVRLVDSWDVRDWHGVTLDHDSYVIIVTRDHAVDQKLLESLVDRDLAYLGMIGSQRKVQLFHRRLQAKGVDPARLARLQAPIGLDIGADTPEEIAVAIVAQLIQVRAARRRTAAKPTP
jgi:xanthine dehydrogenase accessory factor